MALRGDTSTGESGRWSSRPAVVLVAAVVVTATLAPLAATGTGDASTTGVAAATTASCSGSGIYRPYHYKADELATGRTNATQRIRDVDFAVGSDGGNITVTFNISRLANRGVDLSGLDAVVTSTAKGTASASASVDPAAGNVSVNVTEQAGDGDDTAQFSLRLTGLDTTGAATGTAPYSIALDPCQDGSVEWLITPDSDYGDAENVSLFRPVVDLGAGPATMATGDRAVVQRVHLNGTPADPLEPTELVVQNTGNLTNRSVAAIEVAYGSRWTTTISGPELAGFNKSASGLVVNLSNRNSKVTGALNVTVTLELTDRADLLEAKGVLQPEFTVGVATTDSLTAEAANVTDGTPTTAVQPLGDASLSQRGRTAGRTAAYNGTFTVQNASGTYDRLVLELGDARGPPGQWNTLGGSFAGVSMANVTVTVNGVDIVNRSASLDVVSGGSGLAIPLQGTTVAEGDVVVVNVTGVRNPDTTGEYRVSFTLNPAGGNHVVAPPGRVVVDTGYANGSTAAVQSAVAYDPPASGARVELVVDRSLEPAAVDAANFTVYVNGTPVAVSSAAVAGNDRRVVLTADFDTRNVTTVTAWGTNYTVTATERTLVEAGANGSGYANEPAALVADDSARNITLRKAGGVWDHRETGTYSQVVVVYPGSGTYGVDWAGDGLAVGGEDVTYDVRKPTVTVHAPRNDADGEPAGVTVNWTVDAPPDYGVRVVLDDFYREQPAAVRDFGGNGSTTFGNLSVGRHRVDVKLLASGSEGTYTVDSVGRRFQVDQVDERWRLNLTADLLARDGTTLYAMSYQENVTAVSTDGSVLWRRTFDTGGDHGVDLAAADGRAYALLKNQTVVAFDATTGDVLWLANYSSNRPIDLAADADQVYVGMQDYKDGTGGVVALHAANGTESWRNTSFDNGQGLTVAGDTLLVRPGPLRALWTANGTQRWRTSFSLDTVTAVTVENGTVLAVESTCCDNLHAIDLASGNRTRLAEIGHDTPMGAATTRGPALVTRAFNYPYVFATTPYTGDLYWQYYGLYRATTLVADNDTVYVAGRDNGTQRLVAVVAPTPAHAVASGPSLGMPGENLTFDGRASLGTVDTYEWTVEGGGTTTGPTANLTAAPGGVYNVTLTVTSPDGLSDSTTRRIIVSVREGTAVPWLVQAGTGVELNASELSTVADVTWRFRGEQNASAVVRTPGRLSGVFTARLAASGDGWNDSANYTVAVSRGSAAWTAGNADRVVYSDGTVVGTNESAITAYDAATGDRRWNYTVGANYDSLRDTDGIDVAGDVVVLTHDDYDGSYEQDVVGVVNGTKVWERTFQTDTKIDSTTGVAFVGVATNDSRAFVELADGRVVALNTTVTYPDSSGATPTSTLTSTGSESTAGNGSTVWSTSNFDGEIGDLAHHNGTVYVVTLATDLHVYALDADGGSRLGESIVRWETTVPARDFSTTRLSNPRPVVAVANDGGTETVVVAVGANVTALDASGNRLWRHTLEGVRSPVAGTTLRTVQPIPEVLGVDADDGRVTVAAATKYYVNYGRDYSDRRFRTRTVTFTLDGQRLWTNVTGRRAWTVERSPDRVYLGTGYDGSNLTALPEPHAPPVVHVDAPSSVTTGETFTLQGTAASDTATLSGATFEWSTPSGTATGANYTTSIDDAGTYEFTLTVTDRFGESRSRTVTVTVESTSSGGSSGGSGGSSTATPTPTPTPTSDGGGTGGDTGSTTTPTATETATGSPTPTASPTDSPTDTETETTTATDTPEVATTPTPTATESPTDTPTATATPSPTVEFSLVPVPGFGPVTAFLAFLVVVVIARRRL